MMGCASWCTYQFVVTTRPSMPLASMEQPSDVWRDMALTVLVCMPGESGQFTVLSSQSQQSDRG